MPSSVLALNTRHFVALAEHRPVAEGGIATRYARTQNTLIAWSDIAGTSATLRQEPAQEIFVVLPDVGATLVAGNRRMEAPARSICILPPGGSSIELKAPGRVIRFFSPVPEAHAAQAVNGGDYATPHDGVRPIGQPFVPVEGFGIRIYDIDRLKAMAGRRPPSFQTATMNIMWIERDGASDPSKLDPHSHDDFEECALVVSGEYLQHLRTPWGSDASQWQEDEHARCSPGTVTIVPPNVIHTNEALGAGRHIMFNIFAPAREDHIKSGMVLNAAEYRPV
jgi:mannose-6-phosphate isomerase-like protein (cupin superfamily)